MLLYVVFFSITITACPHGCKQPQDNQNSWTQFFKVDKNRFADSGVNPFFILKPGYFLILEGEEEGKTIKLMVTVLNKTKIIDDVKTRVVEEREFCNNELIEVSRNYFAIDTLTNSIFYFGEEVDIHEKGKIVSHEGAWHQEVMTRDLV